MTYYLGLNSYHAGSSACLFKNGNIICAIEEERINRIKNSAGFPIKSIVECLNFENIKINDIKFITVNSNPFSNFSIKLKNLIISKKKILKINNFLNRNLKKISIKNILEKEFKTKINAKIIRTDHHLSHISSAYFLSNYKKCIGISIDGLGDFASLCITKCENNKITVLEKEFYPGSLGIFYEGITQYLGFNNYGDEYKVMGLSGYGFPKYKKILKNIFTEKNSIKLNQKYINNIFEKKTKLIGKPKSPKILNNNFNKLFSKFKNEKKFKENFASSCQSLYEEKLENIINKSMNLYNSKKIIMAGGCALNSLANGKVFSKLKLKNIFIPYMPGDNGGAIGSCLYQINKDKIKINKKKLQLPFITPFNRNKFISVQNLKKKYKKLNRNFKFFNMKNNYQVNKFIASKIYKKKIVAIYRDRMEFGPRALGNRSIICSPTLKNAKEILNSKIKLREKFRPFAPSILEEKVDSWFDNSVKSPYMSFVCKIKKQKRKIIPAVCHVDGTGRLQTLNKNINPSFYGLIKEFYKISKIPIVLNTSFNIDEPIVYTYEDAINTFLKSKIDVLVLNQLIIVR